MQLNTTLRLSTVGLCLLGLAGCAGYQARPLKRLATPTRKHSQEKSVSFSYHVFSKKDCMRYLDRDVLCKGYQPIHITIANNTDSRLFFSLSNFSFPCVYPDAVAKKVHTSTATRVASYGIGSLFIPFLIIPAVVDGVGSSHANHQLDFDFDNKSLDDQEINPSSSISGLIFVRKHDFDPEFNMALINLENNERIILDTANPSALLQ